MKAERAFQIEIPRSRKRAKIKEKPIVKERATRSERPKTTERPSFEDVLAVRTLVRAREDFQSIRKKMDNRIGRKANGEEQNIEKRTFLLDDAKMFEGISDACRAQEEDIAKKLHSTLKRFPIYNEYLLGIKGVGDIAAGWIIGEFDIHKAITVSKMWQFAGLNPGKVQGKKIEELPNGKRIIVITDTMVRADKLTPGFCAPFNQGLRTALVGVLADGFIKQQNDYCMRFYYPMKARLEQEANTVTHMGKETAWSDVSKGHRDRAAKRYMIKMFLLDLYVAWRTIEDLPVRKPYAEEYLGKHHAI